MKAVLLTDWHGRSHAVFVRNEITDDQIERLRECAEKYGMLIDVFNVFPAEEIEDICEEIDALNCE